MSKQVDLTQPLSDEDLQYLKDRDDRYALALASAQTGVDYTAPGGFDPFGAPEIGEQSGPGLPPGLEPDENPDEDPDELKAVEDMNVEELKDELKELGQPVSGNKDELQMRLLEARAESSNA